MPTCTTYTTCPHTCNPISFVFLADQLWSKVFPLPFRMNALRLLVSSYPQSKIFRTISYHTSLPHLAYIQIAAVHIFFFAWEKHQEVRLLCNAIIARFVWCASRISPISFFFKRRISSSSLLRCILQEGDFSFLKKGISPTHTLVPHTHTHAQFRSIEEDSSGGHTPLTSNTVQACIWPFHLWSPFQPNPRAHPRAHPHQQLLFFKFNNNSMSIPYPPPVPLTPHIQILGTHHRQSELALALH